MFIAIEYINDDGTRHSFTTLPGSRAHREALEHEAAGVCVVVEEVDLDDSDMDFYFDR